MPASIRRGIEAVEVTSQSATPGTGERLLYPKSDGWYEKNAAGVETKVGPSAGGGGSSSADYTLTTDYSSTTPTAPTTGVKLFARHRARRLPAYIGPNGLDLALQPGFFTTKIARVTAQNAVAAFTVDGINAPTAYTAASAVANAGSSFFNSLVRTRYPTANPAGSAGGFRWTTPQFMLSSTANMGGFFWVLRAGLQAHNTLGRAFFGLSTTTGAFGNVNPDTLLNQIGFGADSGGVNWYFHSAGASTNTRTDTGLSSRNYGTEFFEFRLFAPSGAGQQVFWSIQRLNDGVIAQGGPVTTNLPAVNTLMTSQVWINNGGGSGVSNLDVQSLYIETDN